jgi:ABC-type multidrug transport system fused ATPase/permease subunit
MTALFLGLIKLLGSAGFGTIFGGLMGWLNRREDLKVKELDLRDRADQRTHELEMRDKDAAVMEKEWAGRQRVAEVEGAAQTERQAYSALEKSYEFAQPDKGSKMSAFSSFIRPFLSLAYFFVTSAGGAWIIYYAFVVKGMVLTGDQLFDIVMFVVSWVAFMGGATIGWWFAMRPGGQPPVLKLR